MREILLELLGKPSGKPSSRQSAWRRLRGAVWLDHAHWISGMELKAFVKRFVHRDRSESNLVAKWKAGSVLPSRSSAIMLEKRLPNTLHIFDLPLYELLGDRPLPAHQVEDVIASLRKKIGIGWEWRFPGSPNGYYNALPNDSSALVSRGDLWGFIAIVALVRQAEIQSDELSHLLLSMDMYRALPAVLKLPWIAPSTELLQNCVNSVRRRMPISAVMYDVDWSVIARHTADPDYEPGYERRIDPATGKTIEFEDPILEARLIRGIQVRAQRRSRERQKNRGHVRTDEGNS